MYTAMKIKIQRCIGTLLYWLMALIGHLPIWWHYLCADLITLILRRVVRYRYEVVISQLKTSFPEKSPEEIDQIASDFYSYLGDLIVEYFRLAAFRADDLHRHLRFYKSERIAELHRQGHPIVYVGLGHYCNWEWLTGLQCYLSETNLHVLHKPQGVIMDEVMRRLRSKFGTDMIDKNLAPRRILTISKDKLHNHLAVFVADQAPSPLNAHLFTRFLGRETPVFTGMERLARKTKAPVAYLDVRYEGRGEYSCTFEVITDDASKYQPGELSLIFMKRMEDTIMRRPGRWLWSHRRWKYTQDTLLRNFPNQEIYEPKGEKNDSSL